ncbi:MAG: DUF692 domain-containing protein [Gammaproteobacteria bacterium]
MYRPNHPQRPYLGFGLGLRSEHYRALLAGEAAVDWLEIISENYLIPGGKPRYYLDRLTERYPLVMHGVSLSIGSVEPLDWDYLQALKALADRVQPAWVSDHLCWTGIDGTNLHDLLPLPYTEEALKHVVQRLNVVQDFLARPFLIENVSSYITYQQSELTEWEFLAAVAGEADCGILLDVNNIYVSAYNHGFPPHDYIDQIPRERVYQIHLAGHTDRGHSLIDTHDSAIIPPVWQLYGYAVQRFGAVSTMIERDDRIPPLQDLLDELAQARSLTQRFRAMQTAPA